MGGWVDGRLAGVMTLGWGTRPLRAVQRLTSRYGETRGPRDYETTRALGFTRWLRKQFRYAYPLCGRRQWRELKAFDFETVGRE